MGVRAKIAVVTAATLTLGVGISSAVLADDPPMRGGVLEILHTPPVAQAAGQPVLLEFRAHCLDPERTPLPGSGSGDMCSGHDFELTVSRDGRKAEVTAVSYDAKEGMFSAQLAADGARSLQYSASLAWHGRTVTESGDVLLAPARAVQVPPGVLNRRNEAARAAALPWKRDVVQPLFSGGNATGPTGWSATRAGLRWFVDTGGDALVAVTSEGQRSHRHALPVPAASITDLELTQSRGPGGGDGALLVSQVGTATQVTLVDLPTGQTKGKAILPTGRQAGFIITDERGEVELVSYPGPRTQRVSLEGGALVLGEPRLDRAVTNGSADERMRVSVTDEAATYCLSAGTTSGCYRLEASQLDGRSLGEVAFVGRDASRRVIVVQKVYDDASDFYLVVELSKARAAVVASLPSGGAMELPPGARFGLSEDFTALEQLATTDQGIQISSLRVGE